MMKRVHIVGWKNSGKTTLVADLVRHLAGLGYRVGTIKHTHHQHELDTPGKDSHRHREAGSAVVGILSPGMSAVFAPTPSIVEPEESRYRSIAPLFANCDLVLVEGDLQTSAPKCEVWRGALRQPPLAAQHSSIAAVISDDAAEVDVPTWPRSDIAKVAFAILKLSNSEDLTGAVSASAPLA